MKPLQVIISLVFVTSTALSTNVSADTCDRCQACTTCRKVCRLKCEEREVEVTCWGCKTEEFCVPCPSEPGCMHCETTCADCSNADKDENVQTAPKKFVWTQWLPTSAKVHTKKVLMMKKEKKTIPSYRWVIEDLCAHCRDRSSDQATTDSSAANDTADSYLLPTPVQSIAKTPPPTP